MWKCSPNTFARHCTPLPPLQESVVRISKIWISTNLYQSSEVFQHTLHRQMLEDIVSQVKTRQLDSREYTDGEALQSVVVEKQQLKGRHGVKGPGIYHTDLVVLQVKEPKVRKQKQILSVYSNKKKRQMGHAPTA